MILRFFFAICTSYSFCIAKLPRNLLPPINLNMQSGNKHGLLEHNFSSRSTKQYYTTKKVMIEYSAK